MRAICQVIALLALLDACDGVQRNAQVVPEEDDQPLSGMQRAFPHYDPKKSLKHSLPKRGIQLTAWPWSKSTPEESKEKKNDWRTMLMREFSEEQPQDTMSLTLASEPAVLVADPTNAPPEEENMPSEESKPDPKEQKKAKKAKRLDGLKSESKFLRVALDNSLESDAESFDAGMAHERSTVLVDDMRAAVADIMRQLTNMVEDGNTTAKVTRRESKRQMKKAQQKLEQFDSLASGSTLRIFESAFNQLDNVGDSQKKAVKASKVINKIGDVLDELSSKLFEVDTLVRDELDQKMKYAKKADESIDETPYQDLSKQIASQMKRANARLTTLKDMLPQLKRHLSLAHSLP